MPSLKVIHAGFHGIEIKLTGNMPGISPEEHIGIRPVQDGVFIGLAPGAVTGMEIRRNVLGLFDVNIAWRESVEPLFQCGRRDIRGRFEVANLVKGMDAGIGSSGCDQGAKPAGHATDRFFQDTLEGRLLLLALPAEKATPIIREDQPDIFFHHRDIRKEPSVVIGKRKAPLQRRASVAISILPQDGLTGAKPIKRSRGHNEAENPPL